MPILFSAKHSESPERIPLPQISQETPQLYFKAIFTAILYEIIANYLFYHYYYRNI